MASQKVKDYEMQITPVYVKVYESVSKNKITVNRWGTRSGKTYSTCQLIFLWLITGSFGKRYIPDGVCSIVRRWKSSIVGTVLRDREEIVADFYEKHPENANCIQENKTLKTFEFQGRTVEFIGADNPQKIKGAKRKILYCNEANELEYKTQFFQLNIRTSEAVIIDFNPDDEDIRINTEIEQKRQYTKKDVGVIVSTYKDNPFLSEEEVNEIEMIAEIDPQLWQVYGKWEYGKVTGTIYNNREIIDSVPKEAEYIGHGLDFGFSSHPAALVGLYRWNGGIVIDEEFYASGHTNSEMSKKRIDNGVSQKIDITADSAEPKSIKELSDLKRRIEAVEKWPDSVQYGIQLLQSFKLYITSSSTNTVKEIKKYKRRVDKNGKTLEEPIKEYDHAMDAIRYCAMKKLGIRKKKIHLISNY